jgi:hypothetical protein
MKFIYSWCLLLCSLSGCNFLDAGLPDDKIVEEIVYSNDKDAAAVLTGVYYRLSSVRGLGAGISSITLYGGLSADELSLYSGDPFLVSLYENRLTSQEVPCWSELYEYIYQVNAAIEGLNASIKLTPAVKQQLLGEAKFMRAFYYFYLVNFFRDVPLLTTADYKENAKASRSTTANVYKQVVEDLQAAQKLLTDHYMNGTVTVPVTERLRPNKWAATALLARVYLYTGQWAKAEDEASAVIDQHILYGMMPVNDVFLRSSKEAIWQLGLVDGEENTKDALMYVLTAGPDDFSHPVSAGEFLLNAFEANDLRRINWIGLITIEDTDYFYPQKYKLSSNDYLVVLRLAEQYLIRAEAKTQLNNIPGGLQDLNIIRQRAGLKRFSTTKKELLLSAILHEKQVELFLEWGHRWLDLKRSGQVNKVMQELATYKETVWEKNRQWYPVPASDILLNPHLTQNEGY